MNQDDGYIGQESASNQASDFNAQAFVIQQLIGKIATAMLVSVQAVTNTGQDIAVGFVDVLPLVNQIDGAGNATPHGIIHNVPYFRLQGGKNAVILDPQIGDIGVAVFASRDISSVKATKGQANPGSFRQYDWADGLYLGGFLNGVPTQFVQFLIDGNGNPAGIKVVSPTQIICQAPVINLNGSTSVTIDTETFTVNASSGIGLMGDVSSTGTFTNNNVDTSSNHFHGGVTVGTGNSGVPAG